MATAMIPTAVSDGSGGRVTIYRKTRKPTTLPQTHPMGVSKLVRSQHNRLIEQIVVRIGVLSNAQRVDGVKLRKSLRKKHSYEFIQNVAPLLMEDGDVATYFADRLVDGTDELHLAELQRFMVYVPDIDCERLFTLLSLIRYCRRLNEGAWSIHDSAEEDTRKSVVLIRVTDSFMTLDEEMESSSHGGLFLGTAMGASNYLLDPMRPFRRQLPVVSSDMLNLIVDLDWDADRLIAAVERHRTVDVNFLRAVILEGINPALAEGAL